MMAEDLHVWTNLAQIHVMMGDPEEAYHLLMDASSVNPLDWEVWRDLAIMSENCEKFDIFINAYSRHSISFFSHSKIPAGSVLMALNGKYQNDKLLTNFVNAVVSHVKQGGSSKLIESTMSLFNSLSEQNSQNPTVWALKARIASYSAGKADREQVPTMIDQALVAINADNFWFRNHTKVLKVMFDTKVIVNTMLDIYELYSPSTATMIITKGKVQLEKILSILTEEYRDIVKNKIRKEIENEVNVLECLLMTINYILPETRK